MKFGLEIDFEVEIQSRDRGSGYCRAVADAGLYLCASFTVSVERVRSLNERLSYNRVVRGQRLSAQIPPPGRVNVLKDSETCPSRRFQKCQAVNKHVHTCRGGYFYVANRPQMCFN